MDPKNEITRDMRGEYRTFAVTPDVGNTTLNISTGQPPLGSQITPVPEN
jgi:hypothetical protein